MTSEADHQTVRSARLLRNRNFVLLWCAYGVSAMGDHLAEMAILKTQHGLDPDVDVTPLDARMTFMFFVPFFLLGPAAGLLADRLPRRALMITADVVRCVVLFFLARMIAAMPSWGGWGFSTPLLLVGVFAAVFSPARAALLPTIIRRDQLVSANGMIAGLGIVATMIAIGIGGKLADTYDAHVAFWTDAATFLLSATLLLGLTPPRQHRPGVTLRALGASASPVAGTPLADLLRGFRYVRTHRRVIELLSISVLVWFCGPLVKSVIPAIVRDVYDKSSYADMSYYRVYLGVGIIIGAIIISILGDALRSQIAITWGLVGISAGIAVFAASVFLPFAPATLYAIGAVGVMTAGVFAAATMAGLNTLLQRIVPDRYRGRVFGVRDLATTAALLLATGAIGVPRWTNVDAWVGYILAGVAVIMGAAGFITLRVRLRRGVGGTALTWAVNTTEFVAKFWWRLRRVGPATVPHEGAAIITANHTCSADPLFLHAAVTYRPIAFLVAVEYTTWPVFRFFMGLVECIPVHRDNRDTAAMKRALRHLRDGKAVGIFIEGRMVPPGETAHPKDGVAMLALRTGAAVIPAHISGVTYRPSIVRGLLGRHHARVHFGPPVDLDAFRTGRKADRATLRAATRRIYAAIQDLAPPGQQRTNVVFDDADQEASE
ncbi:MAG: MFS transporter [Phycisphaerae bacterium]